MRICVLNPSYEDSKSPFKGHDPLCDPGHWVPEHEWSRALIHKATAGAQIRDLAKQGFDAFINLCDGAWDEDRPGIDVVRLLEQMGLAFTGATSGFYEPTRETMKRVCRYMDVGTPGYAFVTDLSGVERALKTLSFPMIVKHENSYGSVGMTKLSRVTDAASLTAQCLRMIDLHGGALVEEFIEGREFTVLVAENPDDPGEPLSFTPVECRFPAGETFKHFDLKWKDFEGMAWFPVEDPHLGERLREASKRLFLGLNGTGYGRCDIRVDAGGDLFVLEINPNCGIFYPEETWGSADFILANDPIGHHGFITHILNVALARQAKLRPRFTISDNGRGGFGMFAAVDLAEGDVIDPWEERPHRLVTDGHVAAHWRGRQQRWFAHYAWPMGDGVHVIWHEDPADWRPIDHSCEPNSWVRGLDLVARFPIAAGSEITSDYGTFCGESMAPFRCGCKSENCRGQITGTDWRLDAIGRYGDHVSPWVSMKRRALADSLKLSAENH